jgi:L-rhamnose-H+ transport protein
MNGAVGLGIALTLFAGVLSGTCMLPMKFVRRWAWENTWAVFSIVSLMLLPWSLALFIVRDLFAVYGALPISQLALPFVLGAGWGIAQVLFGISIARLGMALGYAVIIGLGSLLGTLVPIFVEKSDIIGTGRGNIIFAGLAVMIAGIGVSAWAGQLRDQTGGAPAGVKYGSALALAVVCGLMAPMLNYAFAFGQPIANEAVRFGNSREASGYAVWPVALTGGLIPNLAYSWYLLNRNRTWVRFREGSTMDPFPGAAMAILWMGAFAVYGVSAVYLGDLGTSVGWALFQIFMIMTANLAGVFTGEWRAASKQARSLLWIGLALLALATTVVAAGVR